MAGGYGVVSASVGYEFSKGWGNDEVARNLLDKELRDRLDDPDGTRKTEPRLAARLPLTDQLAFVRQK